MRRVYCLGKEALDPAKQYYTAMAQTEAQIKNHPGDRAFLAGALRQALAKRDQAGARVVGNEYADCVKDSFTQEDIELLSQVQYSTTQDKYSSGFSIMR